MISNDKVREHTQQQKLEDVTHERCLDQVGTAYWMHETTMSCSDVVGVLCERSDRIAYEVRLCLAARTFYVSVNFDSNYGYIYLF